MAGAASWRDMARAVQEAIRKGIRHMYGVIIGDLVGTAMERSGAEAITGDAGFFVRNLLEGEGRPPYRAGEDFSDKTVLSAALEEGLVRFAQALPGLLAGLPEADPVSRLPEEKAGRDVPDASGKLPAGIFEEAFRRELVSSLRRFGRAHPLAGYPMEVSIWLFREGAPVPGAEDPGLAARTCAVAWAFQDDFYMMRHMARAAAGLTSGDGASLRAAEAAACAVFLALHGATKDYIRDYMAREFGYGQTGNAAALCVQTALTAFLYGRDFEDVLGRACALAGGQTAFSGGQASTACALAGALAEAWFGTPEEWIQACRQRLPKDLGRAADDFAAAQARKKEARAQSPAARARWETAITRASERHPAAVQGNEPLEAAIARMRKASDQASLVAVLETIRLRMHQKGRVYVPVLSARRQEARDQADAPGNVLDLPREGMSRADGATTPAAPPNAIRYRMQALRTRDGRLWQPAYTSRAQLDLASQALRQHAPELASGLVLSYALAPLLKRFLPDVEAGPPASAGRASGLAASPKAPLPADADGKALPPVPPEIAGLVFNPYGQPFFLPRETILALFRADRAMTV